MTDPQRFKDGLLAEIPGLRAFAISVAGNVERADDLVQDTLMKAWGNMHAYAEGTNMRAWLFTILRNTFYSNYRKRSREVEDDGTYAARLAVHGEQDGHMDLRDFRAALNKLPPDQREALILVGASGFSYEEAAEICGCALGTIKSRINRARTRLAELLAVDSVDDFGPDARSHAVLNAGPRRATIAK
ncbi:sigma-70 family RNA polymerase sigma factor [Chelatococcus sp. SYSU_G07232]|uniref:RNA polymerase sigma factor n=1 Tax=Chelatococcus albus TaxID=3047466 RepID=A0ABT7AHG8_9HYPH|nr:sigma-70 family RNA polymerase sigma factor [Chelatococcus sp. SYSU_G07232]MDJ1158530.1 sigma-70 family RNA polymerase sigma factor [Chelatococcus sp. SYSU_G07232]